MAYQWQRWMPDELRAAGLQVVEVDGWRNRGRPASTGHFQPRGLNTTHHTAATSSASNPAPGLQTLINGRSDLPGPLCQTAIDYRGVVYVIAAGRANVNGKKRAVPNWPESDGNEQMGCEVITNGTQALPDAQIRSIAIHNAVMLRHFGRSPHGYLYRHQDISLSGKWDIGNRTTAQLRADVDNITTGDDDMPSSNEVAHAVWDMFLETGDEAGSQPAWSLLRDARLRAARTWDTKFDNGDGSEQPAWTVLRDTRALIAQLLARLDRLERSLTEDGDDSDA